MFTYCAQSARVLRPPFIAATVACLVGLLVPAGTSFAQLSYNAGPSYWHVTHNPGGPGGSSHQILNQALQNTSSPTITYDHTTLFQGSGSTRAKAGVGRTQSSTQGKIVWPAGLGVDQIDPSHTQSSSVIRVDFKAVWDVTSNFGPSITGVFSVPFGAKVGSGGSALFEANVSWDKVINGAGPTAARTSWSMSQAFGPGTYLTTFSAPSAPFGPLTMTNSAGVDQLIVRGWVQFAANNNHSGPVYTSFPESGNEPQQFLPRPGSESEDEAVLLEIPDAGFEVDTENIPEPAALSLLVAAPLVLTRTRRRRCS